MAHSIDLRKRVVAFVKEGGSKSEAARRFSVSRWCVYDWLSRESLEAEKQGPKGPRKLSPETLKAHVETYPDAYQYERALDLGVSRHVVLYGLKRLRLSRKKNGTLPRKK